MKVVTAQQMQEIDRITIQQYGIPGEVLMALAGKSVADYVLHTVKANSVAVFCGVGNNGGDGFVAAYLLSQHLPVDVFILGNTDKLTPSSKIYYDVCQHAKVRCFAISSESLPTIHWETYDCIIDALTGTGFSGKPKGLLEQVISYINKSGKMVIAIDMPSGLPADGAVESEPIVQAHTTITMGLPKINLVTYPGKYYAGNVIVADIGFPSALCTSGDICRQLIDEEFFTSNYRPATHYDAHKGANGHLLCIGGFDGMEGAILLCAKAAFAAGIGLVTLVTTQQSRAIIAGKIPEAITRALNATANEPFVKDMYNTVEFTSIYKEMLAQLENIVQLSRPTVCIIGPGLGRNASSAATVAACLKIAHTIKLPIIIDGDGLYCLAQLPEAKLPLHCIITPHFKEAERLTGTAVSDLKKNRLLSAEGLAHKIQCIVVLKGPASIVTNGSATYINTTGNPALATGGSGDVLSGIMGSLLAKGYEPAIAAALGVYIHGKAADVYYCETGNTMMQASDIVEYIRKAVKQT
ncbi:MAG: NAD(P)H-hydrate dehydratase [Spirochaetota bacterium]